MLTSHIRFGICCGLALFLGSFSAQAAISAPRLSPRYDLGSGSLAPAAVNVYIGMTAAKVRDGFVVAWALAGRNGELNIAQLGPDGAVISSSKIFISVKDNRHTFSLVSASDGDETIVLVSQGAESHVPVHVSADGDIRAGLPRQEAGWASALEWNGVAYIAQVGQRVWELDRAGRLVADVPMPAFAAGTAHVVVDGRNVSMLRSSEGSVWRAVLTNGEGHVVAPVWTRMPLVVDLAGAVVAAGSDGRGLYVIVHRPLANAPQFTFQFLDSEGAPNAVPVALEGFTGLMRTTTAEEGAVIAVQNDGGRVAHVKRRGNFDRPDGLSRDRPDTDPDVERPVPFPSWPTVKTSAGSRYRYGGAWDLLPAGDGALFVAPVVSDYEGSQFRIAAVTLLRANGGEIAVDAPTVLEYSQAAMRYGAATAHGRGFLVVWQQPGLDGAEIWMRYLEGEGVLNAPPRFLGCGRRPKIASQGDVALAAWSSTSPSPVSHSIQAIRIGPEGMPLDPVPAKATVPVGSAVLHVGFDTTQFNIFYGFGYMTTATARVPFSPSSTPFTLTLDSNQIAYQPSAIATAPGSTLFSSGFVWGSNGYVISAVALRHDLTPRAAPRMISILPGEPCAVWNGDHFVLAWWHLDHFRYARVSATGEPLDTEYGRFLSKLPLLPGLANNVTFKMILRGEQFVVALPRSGTGRPALVALLEPGEQPGESEAGAYLQEDTIEALVDRADGTVLLLTGHDVDTRLFARYVYP